MNILFTDNAKVIRAFKRISLLTLLSFLMVGCFAPAIVSERNHGCQLATKKLTLTLSEDGSHVLMEALSSSHCHTPECLLIVPLSAVAVSVTSLIVSGSIVVVGNTIHWIEKQGTCENSITQSVVRGLADSMKAIGGKTIQSTTDFVTWFKQLFSD